MTRYFAPTLLPPSTSRRAQRRTFSEKEARPNHRHLQGAGVQARRGGNHHARILKSGGSTEANSIYLQPSREKMKTCI